MLDLENHKSLTSDHNSIALVKKKSYFHNFYLMPVYIYAQFKGLYDCHGHLFRKYISHNVYTVGLCLEPEFYHYLIKTLNDIQWCTKNCGKGS